MFDIGWSEMLMLAVLAVIVVGPKDLPQVLRVVGKWVGKARGMAREFQSGLEDIAREAELDTLKSEVNKAASEFEKAASETENEVRQHADVDGTLDPSGTSDNAFSIEDTSSQDAGKQTNSEPESSVSETGSAEGDTAGDWAERYASATAPAHSVPNAEPTADTEPEPADMAAKSRTGT